LHRFSHVGGRDWPIVLQEARHTAEKRTVDTVKKVLESAPPRKFKESVEISFNLRDVDLSVPKNRVDVEVALPKGRGKAIKICLIGSAELAFKAKDVADLVIQPDQLEELAGNKKKVRDLARKFDFFIAEAPLMPVIGKRMGQILGPHGKMPKPILPNADPVPTITAMRNTVRVKSGERRTFHAPVGTRDMTPEDIAENVDFLFKRVLTKLERGRFNIHSAYLKTTMGPAVRFL